MSSKQGPHAMGMRTSANGHGGRNHGDSFHAWGNEAEDMSSKQGPHAMGMRTPANGHGGQGRRVERHAVVMRPWT
jgi:hypothetical protein